MATSMTPSTSPERPRRSWPKRALITVLVLANVAVFGTYFAIRYFTDRFLDSASTNSEVVEELTVASGDGPITFLVIGSDSREALPDDFGDFGNFGGQRADVIMIVQLGDDGAQILSLPRDLKVEIDGFGTQKINAAYAFGGAPLIVRTVTQFTGLPINHYVEMDFFGFASIVDELGGIEVNFSDPARDLKSGLDVQAGRQVLDGQMALAYARSRQYQEYRNGTWQSVDASDLGRIGRQQSLIFGILAAAKRPSIVFDAGSILSAVGDHVTIDDAIGRSTLVDLALAMRNLSPSQIQAATLPTTPATTGGIYYLVADQPAAREVIAAFSGESGLVESSEPLRLRVLNGNGGAGQAGEWAAELEARGFVVESTGDASAFDFPVTQFQARPGEVGRAEDLVAALGFGEVVTGTVPEGVDVLVIMGSDALDQ